MSAPSPRVAWVAVVAWAGFIAGVGAAIKPAGPVWADEATTAVMRAAWMPHVEEAVARTPAQAQVVFGQADPCACDESGMRQLRRWAEQSGLAIQDVDDAPAGVALIDAEGRLRYAGDADALTTSCAGLSGFKYWWAPVDSRVSVVAQFTAPCGCID